MTAVLDVPVADAPEAPPDPAPPVPGRLRRLVRGRPDDPAWVRPALFGLLAVTAVAYLWDLGASGWANSFYSAAVQAGTKSWKAFFFGSFDASNFITVDKPPASLWVMELSARLFGLNAWSILVPQALAGVATVGVLYATVRRWFSAGAALLAGAIVALTPVAALMFRYNNPDALLVLLLTAAAYATVRGIESGRTRWMVLAGTLVGFGFITKMLQALLVLPAIGVAYLLAAPGSPWRRIRQLAATGAATVVAAGWWVLAVQLTPAAARPYVGGSQDDSLWNLIFGYNGFGRLTGNEAGSVTGGPAGGGGASPWGATGLTRLFGADMGTQISWLLPAALVLLVAAVVVAGRRGRRDRLRASMVLWGGTLLVTGMVFSFGRGIIHPYYTVALAPAIGAVVGIGATTLWARRERRAARAALAGVVALTAVWSYALLDRAPTWFPLLRVAVLALGMASALALLGLAHLGAGLRRAVVGVALVASLAGAAAFTIDTVATPHAGAIPTAGPATTAQGGGPPGGGRAGGATGGGGFFPGGAGAGTGGAGGGPFARGGSAAPPPGSAGNAAPSLGAGGSPSPGGAGGFPGAARPGGAGGAGGGLLNSSTPGKALVQRLEHRASHYSWVAATVGANDAAGYQLATGQPVMAIGGFNGTDPAPSLARFERLVAEHRIHYFISGGAGGFGGGGGGSSDARRITAWVADHYTATTVDGVTLYDLSPAR